MTEAAWLTAVLGRAERIPPLSSLLPRREPAEDIAARQRAQARGMRAVFEAQGRVRSWDEWQGRQSGA